VDTLTLRGEFLASRLFYFYFFKEHLDYFNKNTVKKFMCKIEDRVCAEKKN